MKSFDVHSHWAAVAAEAAQAAANTMQQALDLLRCMQGQGAEWALAPYAAGGEADQPPTGDRISKRMPVFWKHQPEVWFSVLERHFIEAGVTADEARFGGASLLQGGHSSEEDTPGSPGGRLCLVQG